MTKRLMRRAARVGIGVCVVVLAFGLTNLLLQPVPGVMEVKSKLIREEMTFLEVHAILGAPQGFPVRHSCAPTIGCWRGPDGTIKVFFYRSWEPEQPEFRVARVAFEQNEEARGLLQLLRVSFGKEREAGESPEARAQSTGAP
jgi:hypothetical protein